VSAPRVTAVVVHWQSVDDTLGCVASLAAEPDVGVVVVENGRRAPVAAALAAAAPRAVCVASAENLGYAGGANLGIRRALADGAEVVLLLNDDVRVRAGATAAALAALAPDARIAAVGAKVLSRDDPSRLWLAFGRVTWGQDLVALVGADAPDGPAFATERDVDWIAGCAMWMRAEALAAVGPFDETFFAYHEEVEWCARARERGWRIVYAPSVVVTHTGRGSGGGPAAIRIRKYFTARNAILFARRHGRPAERARHAFLVAAGLPLQLLWHLPRGRAGEALIKMRGVRDALLGRRPPLEELGLR
jgi:GT2 family glycosyltransferase